MIRHIFLACCLFGLLTCTSDRPDSELSDLASSSSTTEQMDTDRSSRFGETVLDAVRGATWLVKGLECGTSQIGTAFAVGEGILVTSAHVVAGNEAPIISSESVESASRVVAFDAVSDLALLRTEAELGEPLSFAEASVGESVELVGFDENGSELTKRLVVDAIVRATGSDVYGEPAGGRDALQLRGSVERGNSGAPLVNEEGQVVGVIFANSLVGAGISYAVRASEVEDLMGEAKYGAVSSTPCL